MCEKGEERREEAKNFSSGMLVNCEVRVRDGEGGELCERA